MTDSSKELIVPIDLNPETAVALFTEKREAERKAKEAEEREGRMINAGNNLKKVCGLDDDTAGRVVKAIADGQIENLSFC